MIKPRVGDFIQTYTGRAFYPLDVRPEDIDIKDIAHALSLQCRYSGHTNEFYSVAEHSFHVSGSVPPEYALWGLLHDASEAYLVDIPRPFKHLLPQYKEMEERVMGVIADVFGLCLPIPGVVKDIDFRMLINEKEALLNEVGLPWTLPSERVPGVVPHCWRPYVAEQQFLDLFYHLMQPDW